MVSFLETLQTVSQDIIDTQPSNIYGTIIKEYENTVTVETEDGTFENLLCIGTPVLGSACILLSVDEEYICLPVEIQGGGGGSVDIDTSFPLSPSDTHVPSTKLAKNSLDGKADKVHTHDDRYYTETETDTLLNGKQATLVSGTNIKTINNNSLLGSGNITIQGGGGSVIGTGSFSIDEYGHLIVELPDAVDNPYFIDDDGHLYYDTSNTHNGDD